MLNCKFIENSELHLPLQIRNRNHLRVLHTVKRLLALTRLGLGERRFFNYRSLGDREIQPQRLLHCVCQLWEFERRLLLPLHLLLRLIEQQVRIVGQPGRRTVLSIVCVGLPWIIRLHPIIRTFLGCDQLLPQVVNLLLHELFFLLQFEDCFILCSLRLLLALNCLLDLVEHLDLFIVPINLIQRAELFFICTWISLEIK